MKKTISIISLIIITGLQAQSIDIASIGKELAFKLTRGVSANFAYMDSNPGGIREATEDNYETCASGDIRL